MIGAIHAVIVGLGAISILAGLIGLFVEPKSDVPPIILLVGAVLFVPFIGFL